MRFLFLLFGFAFFPGIIHLCAEVETPKPEPETILRNARDVARQTGFVMLKDGRLLFGREGGIANKTLFFKETGALRNRSLNADILSNFPPQTQISAGFAIRCAESLAAADSALTAGNFQLAREKLLESRSFLNKIIPPHADSVFLWHRRSVNELDTKLNARNLTFHEHLLIDKDVLANHRSAGRILFQNQWIDSDRLCKRCSHSGVTRCPNCPDGTLIQRCQHCTNGINLCSNCIGSGQRICTACQGHGKLETLCSRCHGSGVQRNYKVSPSYTHTVPTFGGIYTVVAPGYGYLVDENCSDCAGTGTLTQTCNDCGGRGFSPCPKTTPCTFCKQQGYTFAACPHCRGSRMLKCPECAGKGFKED